RIHHQWLPDRVFYESGISVDTINRLKQMGHRVSDKPRRMGATQSIQRKTGSRLFGASDYRRKGSGAVPQAE
ncbi:MAG: gamma-glutamyltransferase, partial [Porticoccaceae bacterium]